MFFLFLVFVLPLCESVYLFLWSPAWKGLTYWLSCMVSNYKFVTPHWYPGSDVVLDCIVS